MNWLIVEHGLVVGKWGLRVLVRCDGDSSVGFRDGKGEVKPVTPGTQCWGLTVLSSQSVTILHVYKIAVDERLHI